MLEVDLKYLGGKILSARQDCDLTQKELAVQTRLAVKTIQDIEKGCKNPTYDTLARLISRLGISADTLFQVETPTNDDDLRCFIGKFQACSHKNQQILIKLLNFLAELLLDGQNEAEHAE